MFKRIRRATLAFGALLLALVGGSGLGAQTKALNPALPLVHVEHGANSAQAQAAPYVVLVSLDGFRWDYARRDSATHLLSMAAHGASAPDGMLPSFPSLTFPNHLTLVTGLYPEHHGIVGNSFRDPAHTAHYSIKDEAQVSDGSWYQGVPLWSLAESQGMRSACLFWPASDATIAGQQPSWFVRFDGKLEPTEAAQQARIDDVGALLALPAAARPHLILIYFSEPDHSGHLYGPDAPQTRAAELHVDGLIGQLQQAIAASGLPVNLVVVSDHGMAGLKAANGWVSLDRFADLSGFEEDGLELYGKTEADRERLYRELKGKSPLFSVYRLKDVPAELHFNENPRAGDPVIVPEGAYAFRAHSLAAGAPDRPVPAGSHGYNALRVPEMKAIFYAEGPAIRPGATVAPFENVNLYPWVARLLTLEPTTNDGKLTVLASVLREAPASAAIAHRCPCKMKCKRKGGAMAHGGESGTMAMDGEGKKSESGATHPRCPRHQSGAADSADMGGAICPHRNKMMHDGAMHDGADGHKPMMCPRKAMQGGHGSGMDHGSMKMDHEDGQSAAPDTTAAPATGAGK